MKNKIFLSASNGPGSAYSIRSLKECGFEVYAGDANIDSVGRLFADKFYCLPWQSESHYFDVVLSIIEKEQIDIFVPHGENECLEASRIRGKFENLGCVLVAANTNTIETALDKTRLYNFLSQNTSMPMMKYHIVESVEDYEEGLKKLKGLKLCLKPASGSGSRGFVILDEKPMDAMSFFTQKMAFLSVSPSYIRNMLRVSHKIPKLVLMEMLDGPHYDSNLLCKDGEVLFQSVRSREEAKLGTITKGAIVKVPQIESLNKEMARALNITGLVCTQFIGDKIIELNPRWSTSLHYRSINEHLMSIQLFAGHEITINPQDGASYPGLRMLRYWDVITYRPD